MVNHPDVNNQYQSTAYTDSRQQKYYELEDRSWWYQHRKKIFLILADRFFEKTQEILDIGGGNGFNTKALQNAGYDVTLVEPTDKACKNAKERGCKKVLNIPFQKYVGKISQFMCTDVLEHIEEEELFLKNIYDKMPQKGVGILSVPAFMNLWSSEDEVDGHFRRYKISELEEVLHKVGFDVLYSNYCFRFLWIPIYVRRHLLEKLPFIHKVTERDEMEEKNITDKQFLEPSGVAGRLLRFFENSELKSIYDNKKIPYGSSIMCVVKKQMQGIVRI